MDNIEKVIVRKAAAVDNPENKREFTELLEKYVSENMGMFRAFGQANNSIISRLDASSHDKKVGINILAFCSGGAAYELALVLALLQHGYKINNLFMVDPYAKHLGDNFFLLSRRIPKYIYINKIVYATHAKLLAENHDIFNKINMPHIIISATCGATIPWLDTVKLYVSQTDGVHHNIRLLDKIYTTNRANSGNSGNRTLGNENIIHMWGLNDIVDTSPDTIILQFIGWALRWYEPQEGFARGLLRDPEFVKYRLENAKYINEVATKYNISDPTRGYSKYDPGKHKKYTDALENIRKMIGLSSPPLAEAAKPQTDVYDDEKAARELQEQFAQEERDFEYAERLARESQVPAARQLPPPAARQLPPPAARQLPHTPPKKTDAEIAQELYEQEQLDAAFAASLQYQGGGMRVPVFGIVGAGSRRSAEDALETLKNKWNI